MRTPLATALLTVVALPFAGIPPASAQDASRPARAASVVAFALDQFKALTPGVTLARWRLSHPAEPVIRYVPPEQDEDHRGWCAHTDETRRLSSGQRVRRTAWFYPPAPVSTRVLPSADSATLFGQCRVGMIEVVLIGVDTVEFTTVSEHFAEALTAKLGPQTAPPKYSLVRGGRWSTAGINVVAGIGNVYEPPHTVLFQLAVEIAAASKSSEMAVLRDDWEVSGPPTAPPVRIDELFTLADAGNTVEHELRTSLADLQRPGDTAEYVGAVRSDQFINAFSTWLARAPALPPPQRAAALLVADVAIATSGRSGWAAADTGFADVRRRLNALGADLYEEHLSGLVEYHRSFLKQALDVAPGTRAGDIAFLMAARDGFSLGGCGEAGSDYRAVAARGADYIKRFPRSTAVPELHFIVARAWADIVNLGSGSGAEMDSSEIVRDKAEIPLARRHAIAEYRLALATLPEGEARKAARVEGWRLMAGLAPTVAYFHCYSD